MPRPSRSRFCGLVVSGIVLVLMPLVLLASEIPSGPYQVSGTVMNRIGGHPLAGARVTLDDARNRENEKSLVTGDDGHFIFHVPAGKYALGAERRGFLPTFYKEHEQFSTAIVTGAEFSTQDLVLQLSPHPVLKGEVIDEAGEPVRNAAVTVLREGNQTGITQIRPVRRLTTDDQGSYEATPLEEGTYFVMVQTRPWYAVHGVRPQTAEPNDAPPVDPSLDVAYPITYYGDTTDADEATPIPIRGGARIEANIHLSPVPSLHITVHVQRSDTGSYYIPSVQQETLGGMQHVETAGASQLSAGAFEITGVPAGHYTVGQFANSHTQGNEPTEIELSPTNSELDVTSSTPTSSVKVKVRMVGDAQLPVPLRVALRNSKGRATEVRSVNTDGEVTFTNVSTGQYEFRAASQNKPFAAIVSTADGPAGNRLDVSSGSSIEITLLLTGGDATVEGVVQKSGKPVSGAMVVLVPQDPDLRREYFRRDQSDMDGTFSLPQVFPGTYTVIAIENGWDIEWGKPEVLARYTNHAQTITVENRGNHITKITEPVEVQPK